MSNEHHDMASLRGTEMGLDALHAKSADELLMDVPFDERGADRNDLADVADGVGRDALMLAVTTQCSRAVLRWKRRVCGFARWRTGRDARWRCRRMSGGRCGR